ncbi:MAG: hypothetical protein ACRYFV_15875 [Janthinobacterium lividum]
MKKLLCLGACLVALASSPVMAQTVLPGVVVVRVNENNAKKVRVVVAYGNGKTEVTIVEASNSVEGGNAVVEGYQQVFQKLYQQGYSLKTSFTDGQYSYEHTFVFEKRQ